VRSLYLSALEECRFVPQSEMAYDVSATPLRRIFPQFLAMILLFYGAGKAASAIIAAATATADSLARS
jgi:hypothetical protein